MQSPVSPLDSLAGDAPTVREDTAAERVASVIREQIVDGQLAPGVRLTEEVVGSLLNVSRNTVREALAMLVAQRLCERKTNRGVFVVVPTAAMSRDLFAYRMLAESAAILWGTGYTPDALAALRGAVAAGRAARDRAAPDWFAVATANQQFHRAIAALSGSPAFERHFASALAEMRLVFCAAGSPEWQAAYVDGNARVAELLEAGRREEAAAALRSYLAAGRDDVLRRLNPAGRPGR